MKLMIKKVGIIFGILILILFSLIVIFIGGSEIIYRTFGIKTVVQHDTTKYIDEDFGYSIQYPNSWEKENTIFYKGLVDIFPLDDETAMISIWYKDSGQISSLDELIAFVEDDAKYFEDEQRGEVLEIKTEQLNNQDVVSLIAREVYEDNILYSKQYYIADFEPTPDQIIFIWTITAQSEDKDFLESEEFNAVRDSFRFEKSSVGLL